jgi:SAM-dependent methyltransferase
MQTVDYEQIAASYDRRYATTDFAEIARCLSDFLGETGSIAELGCGTGHWLALAAALPQRPFVVGLDPASAMISRARQAAPAAMCVRASANRLPWDRDAFDRIYCVNALHHFPDRPTVYHECRRVLRAHGRFLTIGLDPHARRDRWWIYDYFPAALAADRHRYPSAESIRTELRASGFSRAESLVAQHITARLSFDDAHAQGFLRRESTSQLLVIDDAEWTAGLARLQRDKPVLEADLRLYATIGHCS